MKRTVGLLILGVLGLGGAWAGYQVASPPPPSVRLSRYVPSGSLLYLQAEDFSSLLGDWNASPKKRDWLQSDNYEVFSKSRLFLRLQEAGGQFAAAAGVPPDLKFLGEMAGSQSVLALYDIGKLQFLYITRRAPARSVQSQLWQTRSKFETRTAGSATFYIRRDPQSEREVAFAVNGDYLLLATREDLIAGALQLMQGSNNPTIEAEPWWSGSTSAAGQEGVLRMVLNLDKIVPSPYFRSYWIQQNVTDLRQYTAAVSDIFRSAREYREERVLMKRPVADGNAPTTLDASAVADLVRLVPPENGIYEVQASPSVDMSYRLLDSKILSPHAGRAAAEQTVPQVQLTSGETGDSADMETRIDEAPAAQNAAITDAGEPLKKLLLAAPVRAVLDVQATEPDADGVFVKTHSGVALLAGSDWNEAAVHSALIDIAGPALTASGLGMTWQAKSGYEQLDGLWSLAVAVRGRYLLISDDPALLGSMLGNVDQRIVAQPAIFIAGFNHARERNNFERLTALLDRSNAGLRVTSAVGHAPQFFSGNVASLSSNLAGVSSETIVVHDAGENIGQTVTYTWAQ